MITVFACLRDDKRKIKTLLSNRLYFPLKQIITYLNCRVDLRSPQHACITSMHTVNTKSKNLKRTKLKGKLNFPRTRTSKAQYTLLYHDLFITKTTYFENVLRYIVPTMLLFFFCKIQSDVIANEYEWSPELHLIKI